MNDIEKAVESMRLSILEKKNIAGVINDESHSANEPIIRSVDIALGSSANAAVIVNESSPRIDSKTPSIQIDEIKPNVSKPPTCTLHFNRLKKNGFITPNTQKGKLSEEYRRIKRPLLKNMRNEFISNGLKNVIAVTSALSGEGKTYTAVNLAMSMALEKERTVLLVDADVVKGAAGRLFSVSRSQPGLTDVLYEDSIDISDVIMQTNVKSMRFMPSGKKNINTSELLSSDMMSELIVELARRYDDRIIILDCPPMLQTNEASILVDHAGQVVFVVAEAETRQKLVEGALSQIDEEKYVGLVMNKSNSRFGNYDYYSAAYK